MIIHADGSKCDGSEDCKREAHYTTTNPTPLQSMTSSLNELSGELNLAAEASSGDRMIALKVAAAMLFCGKYLIQQCLMPEPNRQQMEEVIGTCIERISVITKRWQQ